MRYDLRYIVPSTTEDAPMNDVRTKMNEMLQAIHATIIQTEEPGKRKLAYPINGVRHGHYVNIVFEAEPAAAAKLKSNLTLNTDIIRFQIVQEEKTAGKISPQRTPRMIQKPLIKIPTAPVRNTAEEEAGSGKVSLQELDKKLEELLAEEVK